MQTRSTADAKVKKSMSKARETLSGSCHQALSGTVLAKALIEHVAHLELRATPTSS